MTATIHDLCPHKKVRVSPGTNTCLNCGQPVTRRMLTEPDELEQASQEAKRKAKATGLSSIFFLNLWTDWKANHNPTQQPQRPSNKQEIHHG